MITNIRINNHYILKKDNNYYLTDIDQLDAIKETTDFSEFYDNKPITEKVKELLDEFDESDNVNFILKDAVFLKIKNNLNIDPLKSIQLKKDKSVGGG